MSGGADTGEEEAAGPRTNVFGEAPVQPVQLNLTALMDILSNLLFFLLAAFGATIVMVINATVPVQSADESGVADSKRAVTLNVSVNQGGFRVSALGTAFTQEELDAMARTIPLHGKTHDFAALTKHLKGIKENFPKSDTVILTPESGLKYDVLVRTMDAAREYESKEGVTMHTFALFPTVVVSTVVK
jgi:biopolymer transport protein ExbD